MTSPWRMKAARGTWDYVACPCSAGPCSAGWKQLRHSLDEADGCHGHAGHGRDLTWDLVCETPGAQVGGQECSRKAAGKHVCQERGLSQCRFPALMLPAPNGAPQRHLIAKGQPANGKLLSCGIWVAFSPSPRPNPRKTFGFSPVTQGPTPSMPWTVWRSQQTLSEAHTLVLCKASARHGG